MRKSPGISRLVPDTSVLVEYIVENAPYRNTVVNLFNKVRKGFASLYVRICFYMNGH